LAPLVIGLTVVAFGTSAPEIAVSVAAALDGNGGLAAGNVIGSNISNIALILGISAVITPLAVHFKLLRFDIPLMIGVSLLALALSYDGALVRWEGVALSIAMAGYLAFSVIAARREKSPEVAAEFAAEVPAGNGSLAGDLLWIGAGLTLLVAGAHWLVAGASFIARGLGVSEAVIGLTLVALGTSLPELATSVLAALRRHTDLAIGNIVGSNIFNVLGILGLSSALVPYEVTGIQMTDWAVLLGVSLLLLPLAWTGGEVRRWEGFVLVACYAGYIAYLAVRGV
jgi:cation:H+ antiporter